MRLWARAALPVLMTGTLVVAVGCGSGPSADELATVDYAPTTTDEWAVSTPEEHGLDPDAVAEMYWRADQLESIYSLLVLKDGELVAEKYWRAGSPDYQQNVQSVTKSYTGALVGLAIEDGCIPSVDEPMMTYFPELDARVRDERLYDITIEQLLQMRAGYPWEESYPEGVELFYQGFRPSSLLRVPLVRDPGTGGDYSNLSSHLLAIIVSRGCDADLLDFAQEHLFDPLDISVSDWMVDWEGYRLGYAELAVSAMDMARFGQMYLDEGTVDGEQVVPASWVEDSWQAYSEGMWCCKVGDNFDRTAYGYQWWTIDAGPHTYHLAWGHGGQQIAVLPEMDMVVVVTADPLYHQSGDGPWALETANLNLVATFIAGLPQE
jgi:CubicO group peptidase (beta-lactamase class C family)